MRTSVCGLSKLFDVISAGLKIVSSKARYWSHRAVATFALPLEFMCYHVDFDACLWLNCYDMFVIVFGVLCGASLKQLLLRFLLDPATMITSEVFVQRFVAAASKQCLPDAALWIGQKKGFQMVWAEEHFDVLKASLVHGEGKIYSVGLSLSVGFVCVDVDVKLCRCKPSLT